MTKLEKLLKKFRMETNGDKNLKNVVYSDGVFQFRYQPYVGAELENTRCLDEVYVISKQFGFIKWLVDNDKIDTVLFANELNKVVYLADFNFRNDEGFYKTIYKQLLMLLAIQDSPVEYLCEILR